MEFIKILSPLFESIFSPQDKNALRRFDFSLEERKCREKLGSLPLNVRILARREPLRNSSVSFSNFSVRKSDFAVRKLDFPVRKLEFAIRN
jgi:hypothetical protein